jgi:uncharacterized protein (DUF362 family)
MKALPKIVFLGLIAAVIPQAACFWRRIIMRKLKLWVTGSLVAIMLGAFLVNNSTCVSVQPGEFMPRILPDSNVAIVQSPKQNSSEITYDDMLSMAREAVELAGGLAGLVHDGDTVVLKPNLVTVNDYTLPGWQGRPLAPEGNGTTTDWRFTKAVASLVRELDPKGKVYVMEGSSVPTKKAFEHFHYTREYIPDVDRFIAIEEDTEGDHLVKVDVPGGLLKTQYAMNRIYKDANVVISLPVLKNHWHAVVSGGIKNVAIGASPGNIYGNSKKDPVRVNVISHKGIDLHYWIHDYFAARPVDFVIMEGLVGIQNGPTPSSMISGADNLANDQMNMRLVLAGRDPVALDTIESLVMGWDPRTVEYLTLLNKDGYGNIDTAHINVRGKKVDEVRKRFAGSRNIFAYGGSQFDDYDPPVLGIKSIKSEDGKIVLECEPAEDTRKIDVSIEGIKDTVTVTSSFNLISIPLPKGAQPTTVTLTSYDYVLNSYSTTIDASTGKKGDYTAREATIAPLIDGNGDDACWQNTSWHPIDELWLGTKPSKEDFSGRYKITWTHDRLYVLAEITDDVLQDTHPNPLDQYYNDDCIEVFLDEDASGGNHKTNYNAFAYHISLSGDVVDIDTDGTPKLYNDNVTMKMTRVGTLCTWELGIDVYSDRYVYGAKNEKVRLFSGKKMGYAIAYCDSDKGNVRDHFIGSVPISGQDKNIAWIDASVFGSLMLVSSK